MKLGPPKPASPLHAKSMQAKEVQVPAPPMGVAQGNYTTLAYADDIYLLQTFLLCSNFAPVGNSTG